MFRFVNCISLLLHILEVCYAPFSLWLQKFEFERYQKIFLCSNFYQFWQLSHIFVPNHQKRATNSVNCFGGNRHKTVSSHPTELTRKKKLTNLLNKGKSIIDILSNLIQIKDGVSILQISYFHHTLYNVHFRCFLGHCHRRIFDWGIVVSH